MGKGLKEKINFIAGAAALSVLCIVLFVLTANLKKTEYAGLCVAALAAALFAYVLFVIDRIKKYQLIKRLIAIGQEAGAEDDLEEAAPGMSENALLDRIEEKMQQSSLMETLKTEAELHALQNQINPHFLYNTLEIIRSKALIRGNEDVAKMAEALALQFRYCINRSNDLATLEQELENIHNYILIQRYRYGSRFSYREEIADSAKEAMGSVMPVMTMQPLIENALVHGIVPKIEGGCVTLRIEALNDRIYIYIEDDGVGISDEQLRSVRLHLHSNSAVKERRSRTSKSMGIALDNVNQRIKNCFGNGYGVDLVSTLGVGTTVSVTLPRTAE